MKTILYVEECENDFINALVERTDINIVLIRFMQNYNFTEEHIKKTIEIPTFILDKQETLKNEEVRFTNFLNKHNKTIDYFFNDSEYNQEFMQTFARDLNLPGALTKEQAEIVRDKVKMKQFIREIGLECMEYSSVSSKEDVSKFADRIGYPLVIKWKKGVSSIEVYKVSTQKELENLQLDYTTNRYMVEQFCPHRIWCLDAIVSRGEVIGNLIGWLPYTNLEFAEKKQRFVQIAMGKTPSNWKFSVKDLTSKIVNALGVDRGYLHLEAFVTPDGYPIICEFAWRTVGDHMMSDYSISYNRDIFEMLTYALLDEEQERLGSAHSVCGDLFLPVTNGRVKKISSLDMFEKMPQYCSGKILYKEGDNIISKRKYTDSAGWIQVREKNIELLMKVIEDIYEKYYLITV